MPELKNYYTRDYQPGDETAISTLFATGFGRSLPLTQWRWKYTDSPSSTRPIARLAFAHDGQLVGHAGAIALRGWRQHAFVPFFQICDVVIHPTARGGLGRRNLFTLLIRELLSGLAARCPLAFVYGFPGRRPFRLGEYAGVYESVEIATGIVQPTRRHWFSLLGTCSLDWNDMWLDAWWRERAPEFPLTLVRDRSYLAWRYAAHPQRNYRLVSLQRAGRRFGWAVLQVVPPRLRVIDLLVAYSELPRALQALGRLAVTHGLTAVDIWVPADWRQEITGVLEPSEIVVTNMVWHVSLPTATVRKELYYTRGDLDIF